ncbi:SCAN domain-containing protein 3-like [Palaemon carinicauda]|uniref:SCAN domain-containing protein 3-like n=1 Tax=Palaemon carinicauda TaxID=392227 RepID=UPI0035B585EF
MQGGYASVLEVSDKIKAFRGKTDIWRMRVLNGITDMFPQLTEFLNTNKLSVELVRNQIYGHLTPLNENFNSYFTDLYTDAWDWVRGPFVASSSARGLSAKAEEELLELSYDGSQRIQFRQSAHINFWASIKEEYPELFAAASKVLLPFPATYLCKASFSALTAMKTKYRARMHVENDLRICLSSIHLRIEKLCTGRQAHPSH